MSPALTERIDQLIAERMQQGRVPGLSLVILRDGQPVYLRGYGSSNLESGEPMTACSRVSIGSTTKSMTALALMQGVEQGKVELEAPVTRYLPWFQTGDGQGSSILVKHVLSHTSGLPASSLLQGDMDDGALERRVRSLSEVSLESPPGQRWKYANYGYAIAGLLIQTVAGVSYEQYMASHVFEPLGMTHTTFGPPTEDTAPLAQGYVWTRGEVRPAPMLLARAQYASGAATYSSAQDVSAYLRAMLAGGQRGEHRVLTPESLDRMWQPVAANSSNSSYGLGWELGQQYGRRSVFHNGSVVGSGSQFIVFPDEQVAVATLANLNSPTQAEIAQGVAALLWEAEPPVATPLPYRAPSTFVPDTSVWQQYVGDYFSPVYGRVKLHEESGRLMGSVFSVSPTLVVELEAYGDNDFVFRHDLGQLEGIHASFQRGSNGQFFLLANGQPAAVKL